MSARPRRDPTAWFMAALPALFGLATLLPFERAAEPCLLGYRALCSFAPLSSLLCLAGSVLILRLFKPAAS